MSTKTISSYVTGVTLHAPYGVLEVTAAGTVGPDGVTTGSAGTYSIENLGRIAATGTHSGVVLGHGGAVYNGIGLTTALIEGHYGVVVHGAAAGIVNDGTILATGNAAAILLKAGGTVLNGNALDTKSLVKGEAYGIALVGLGMVTNMGTVEATGTGALVSGIGIEGIGQVTNGSLTDKTALVEGSAFGVGVALGSGTVVNFGTIKSTGASPAASGVGLEAGGRVHNGTTADHAALIAGGAFGVGIAKGKGFVFNDATIEGGVGVGLAAGGAVYNGAASDHAAVIGGKVLGVGATGKAATVHNFGAIEAVGGKSGDVGVELEAGGRLVNGAGGDAAARVDGFTGVVVGGNGTVVNYGTIVGTGGTAVHMASAQDLLIVEAGAVFGGVAIGGGGGLNLAGTGAAGTLSGLGTAFAGFGAIRVVAGSRWTFTGAGSVGAGATLDNGGSLTLAGTLAEHGRAFNGGRVVQAGAVTLDLAHGASLDNGVGAVWDITGNHGIGATGSAAGQPIDNAGLLEKTGGTGKATIAAAIFNSGTIAAASGRLALTGGVFGTGALEIAAGASLELGGSVGAHATVDFMAGHVSLVLDTASSFAATIKGFDIAGAAGDAIDVKGFGAGTTVTYQANGSGGGALTVKDGALTATVRLFGAYVAAGFHHTSGATGTVITYQPPPASLHLATPGT